MGNQIDKQINWREDYLKLMGSLALKTEDHDKRKHPRVLLPPEIELFIEIGNESYNVLDISPGGICLVSQYSLSGQSEVNIVYDKEFKLNSEIIYSQMDRTINTDGSEGYRIGAKFLREDEGYRIMVMVLQVYGIRLIDIPTD